MTGEELCRKFRCFMQIFRGIDRICGLAAVAMFFLFASPSSAKGESIPDQLRRHDGELKLLLERIETLEIQVERQNSARREKIPADAPNTTSSPQQFVIDFEDGFFPAEVSGDWRVVELLDTENHYAIRSRGIDSNEATVMSIEAANVGRVSYKYRITSEEDADILTFSANDRIEPQYSGVTRDWRTATHILPPGDYKLQWTYAKDENISEGADRALIDDIVITFHPGKRN